MVGPVEQVGGGVAAWNTLGQTDADGAGQHLAVDGHPFAQHRLQPVGQRRGRLSGHRRRGDHDELVSAESRDELGLVVTALQPLGQDADEGIAGGMAQIVVDRLEPVEVEEHHHDRAGLAGSQPSLQVRHECPAVVQPGEMVVIGQVPQPVLGLDSGLHLGEQRGDRLECVEFCG